MIENGFKVYAQRAPWSGGVELAFTESRGDGRKFQAAPMEMREFKPGEMIAAPLPLSHTEAQFLMDELWNCGLRPSEGSGSAGALAATQKHLDDMRKLVFDMRVTQV